MWALNGAHDFLISKGIIPTHGIAQAPEVGIVDTCFHRCRGDVVYAFASCAHPELFERALGVGAKVVVWNAAEPDDWEIDYDDRPKAGLIHGCGTVGLRALDMAYLLGYREIHVHGFDACLSMDLMYGPERPCPEDTMHNIRVFEARDGSFWPALPSHAIQVNDLPDVVKLLDGLNLIFYGDGLMQRSMKGKYEVR